MAHSQHFLCHRDLVESSGVLFSLFGPFCSQSSSDLVVVYAQHIDVFRIEMPRGSTTSVSSQNVVLHLLHSFPLAGVVESAQLIYLKKSTACLALTFATAKLVLVRYDNGHLATVAMHNFEEDGMGLGTALQGERFGRTQFSGMSSVPITVADPDHRCLSMLLYQDQLVIVPLQDNRQNDLNDDDEDEAIYQIASLKMEDKTRSEQYASMLASFGMTGIVGRTFLLRLRELDIRGKIIDMAFLEGYLEPTLMLLHEESDRQAVVGRYAAGYDTCCLTVLSINTTTRLHPKIWSIASLPSDCFKIVPCPAPLGGAIVFSQNAIMYLNQNQYFGLSTTAFADKTIDSTKYPLHASPLLPDIKMLLTNCQTCLLTPDEMLLNLGGHLFVLSLPSHRSLKQKGYYGHEVCQLMLRQFAPYKLSASTSMAVDLDRRLLFLGTRDGDSHLFRYSTNNEQHTAELITQESVVVRPVPVPDDMDSDEEDMYLYGRRIISNQVVLTPQVAPDQADVPEHVEFAQYQLELLDILTAIGQVTAMDMGVEMEVEGAAPSEELVLSGGVDEQSSISVIHRGIRPVVITEVPLEGCRAMWAVYGSATAKYHGYLILSMKSKTMVLKAGDDTLPLESSGLFVEGPTLAAANILGNQRIVQVYKQGVRLLEETNDTLGCTQELLLEDAIDCDGLGVDPSVGIVSVDILDPYVILLLSDGSLRLIYADANDLDLSVVQPEIDKTEGILCAVCLFHDWGQLFAPSEDTFAPQAHVFERDDDDVDELYNVSSSSQRKSQASRGLDAQESKGKPVYCAICYDFGTMIVFCLPDFTIQAIFPGLNVAPQVLIDSKLTGQIYPSVGLSQDAKKPSMLSPVADICIHRVGPDDAIGNGNIVSKMVLVVYVANGDLLVYVAEGNNGCVVQKLSMGKTIHHLIHVACHGTGAVQEALQTPTYAVVMSHSSPPPLDDGADNEVEEEAEEDGYTPQKPGEIFEGMERSDFSGLMDEQFELQLIQSVDGQLMREGVFSVQMERYEVVLTIKVMYLSDAPVLVPQEWKQKRKPYIVVGTGVVGQNGEDENGKGRLLVYEVDYAQYTNAQGITGRKLPKLNLIYAKEHKQGGISMVSQLGAYVLAAVGSKLIVYELKGGQLVGCAFFDAQLYIVSLNVIKSFIVYGDLYKSIHLLYWKPQEKTIIMLAKDYEPLSITTTEVSVMGTQLGLIASDMQANIHVMQYEPTHVESRGGQRLLRTSDFHVGARVTSLMRKRVLESPIPLYVTLLATAEGGLGVLIPVQERLFRRLYTLQSIMINALPQNAGLNPREFRQAVHTRSTGRPDAWCTWKAKKAFLDTAVIGRFSDLDYVAQRELARCIGTTPEVVLHNLLELQRTTLFL
ncbi:unnamed protein product [Aphanomyces euteiches]